MLFEKVRNQYFEEIELLEKLSVEFQKDLSKYMKLFFIIILETRGDGKVRIEKVHIFSDEEHAFEIYHRDCADSARIATNKFRGGYKLDLIGERWLSDRVVLPDSIQAFLPDMESHLAEAREMHKTMPSIEIYKMFFGLQEELLKKSN